MTGQRVQKSSQQITIKKEERFFGKENCIPIYEKITTKNVGFGQNV